MHTCASYRSTFDGVFLLKHLFKYGKVKPIIDDGKIIAIKLIYNCTITNEDGKIIKIRKLYYLKIVF